MQDQQFHAIYVPGLGDNRSYGQDAAVFAWHKKGIIGHYFPLDWANKEPFEPKLARLIAKVDSLAKQGYKVSLVGASAGASAVLNAYAQRPDLHAVICISGKINNPKTINEIYFRNNPAFKESLNALPASLKKLSSVQRRRILSIHPLYDGTVPVKDTLIRGAVEKTTPIIGHRLSIFYAITFGFNTIAKFIKSQPI